MYYYKKVKVEDKELFNDITDYRLAQLAQTSQPYLNAVKNSRIIISEKQYQRLKELKEKELKRLLDY